MIEDKTLFILGAGASVPYGFPIGETLKRLISSGFAIEYGEKITDEFPDDKYMYEDTVRNIKNHTDKLHRSPFTSIDKFIAGNPSFTNYGKIAILMYILKAEADNDPFDNSSSNSNSVNWYKLLFNFMTTDIKGPKEVEKIKNNNLKIITFNYDRSFEEYFSRAIKDSYESVSLEKINEIVGKFTPQHVFGSLPLDGEGSVTYGKELSVSMLKKQSKNILTIHEAETFKEKYVEQIQWADKIFIIGLGFAKENLEALGLPGNLNTKQKIYATAYKSDQLPIKNFKLLIYKDWIKKKNLPQIVRHEYDRDFEDYFKLRESSDARQLLDEYLLDEYLVD